MALPLAFPQILNRRRQGAIEQRSIYGPIGPSVSLEYVGATSVGDNRLALDPSAELDAYQASEVIYRCVDLIATELSGLDLVLLKSQDGGAEYVEDDPIANVFNKASADADSAVVRKHIMWSKLELHGECFIYMDRGEAKDSDPQDFLVIMDRVTPIIQTEAIDERTGERRALTDREKISPKVMGYIVDTRRWGRVTLLPQEVLWLRYPHPSLPWAPMAPGVAARMAGSLDYAAREWQAGEFQNQARPSGVMRLGSQTPESANRIKQQFQSQATGTKNAGRVLFLYGDDDKPGFDRIGLTPAEMSYLESHKTNGADICLAFGIPIDLIFGQSTFNNQDAAWARLWSGLLVGKKELVEAEVDRQLFPDPGLSAVFDVRHVEALQENTDAIHDRTIKAHQADITTIEEARAKVGLEPLGDERDAMTLTQYQTWVKSQYAPPPPPMLNVPPDLSGLPMDPNAPNAPADATRASIAIPKAVTVADVANQVAGALELPPPVSGVTKRRVINVARVLRSYDRHERLVRRAIENLADKQQKIVMRNLDKAERKHAQAIEQRSDPPPIDPNAVFDTAFWKLATSEALEGPLEGMWADAATATADALNMEVTDLFMARVVQEMRARLDVLSGQVTETTFKVIKDEILREGVEAGEGTAALGDRVLEKFGDLKTWRADTIARTETLSGHSAASHMSAVESGVVTQKEWSTAEDSRVRISHRFIDAQTVALDDKFSNGLRYPGDPFGSSDETVNCRCVLQFLTEEPA